MPNGSMHDEALDHGAKYDIRAFIGLYRQCRDLAPDLARIYEEQADDRERLRALTAQNVRDDQARIFSLPQRHFESAATDAPYAFIATDEQAGNFKKCLFLNMAVDLRAERHLGKALHDMDAQDWAAKIDSDRAARGGITKVISRNRWPGVLNVQSHVLPYSHAAERYRDVW